MGKGFHLGRILGVSIEIDWSWLLIFFLITWNLAFGVFPRFHPQWSLGLNLTIGILASFLFFSSVLAHELAHSVVAKARGIPVSKITLFLFGGVANIQKEPESAKTEFFMAIVGPLTSIILGLFFLNLGGINTLSGIFGNFEPSFSKLSPISTLLIWLGSINVLVALFNLIPGFPLDGGRILRAIIWAITKNFQKATFYASLAGQSIAWFFIFLGISMIFGLSVPIFGSGLLSGVWIAFIGFFLKNAASASYERVMVEDILKNTKASVIMRTNIASVPPGITVRSFVYDYILGTDHHAFAVIDNNKLIGIVCLDDARKISSDKWGEGKVRDIMTTFENLETIGPSQSAADALSKLTQRDVGQLPVLNKGEFLGMLDRRDILLWFQLHTKNKQL